MEWSDDLIAKVVISGAVLLGIVVFLISAFWQPKKKQEECDHDWEVITKMTTTQIKQELRARRCIGLNVEEWWKRMIAAGVEPPHSEHPDAAKFWDDLYPIKQDLLFHRVCLKCHRMENEIQAYAIKLIQAAEQRLYRQQIAQWLLAERSGARDSSTVRVMVLRSSDLPSPQWEYMKHNWLVNTGGYSKYRIREWANTIMANPGAHSRTSLDCASMLDNFLRKRFDLKDYDVVMINDTKEGI